jgi:hypothetical protein
MLISKQPAVQKFVVMLVRDIVSLYETTTENLLTFQMFNGKLYFLIKPISSCLNDSFKQNVIHTKWMDDLLLAVNIDEA